MMNNLIFVVCLCLLLFVDTAGKIGLINLMMKNKTKQMSIEWACVSHDQ